MNNETARILCQINNDFYRNHHVAFSKTRNAPWQGWRRCLKVVRETLLAEQLDDARGLQGLAIFDLACGNLRFERFLASELLEASLSFFAVDNCDGLVPQMPNVTYQSLDILAELTEGQHINDRLEAPACDLSASFGFMHHIPLREQRVETVSALIRQTRPDGLVILSFWQFLNDEGLSGKAKLAHECALSELRAQGTVLDDLDGSDFLLGWENRSGAYRYCHSFSESEIDELVESAADRATVVSRFMADGRTGNLNTYLVLKVL